MTGVGDTRITNVLGECRVGGSYVQYRGWRDGVPVLMVVPCI